MILPSTETEADFFAIPVLILFVTLFVLAWIDTITKWIGKRKKAK